MYEAPTVREINRLNYLMNNRLDKVRVKEENRADVQILIMNLRVYGRPLSIKSSDLLTRLLL